MKTLRAIPFIFAILLLTACATNPVSGKKEFILLSENQEIAMGREYDPQIVASMGLYENQAMQDFINAKGQKMAAISHRSHLDYEFKILDSPAVNAFAIPGGYVYFTRGIMAHFNNEAEFAGVLGHEIGHIAARHSAKQYTNQMLAQIGIVAGVIIKPELIQFADLAQTGIGLLFLKFSRDNESESDKLGVEYSTKIGYDAHEMANFFQTINRLQEESGADQIPNFLSTHPDPSGRFENVHALTEEWQSKVPKPSYAVNRNSYLQMVEGLIYGEDPRQGFVENNVFYHPELKFQFPLPGGWITNNTPLQVQIAPEDGQALIVLSLAAEQSLDETAAAAIERNNLVVEQQQTLNVNGFPSIRLLSTVVNEQDPKANLSVLSYFIQDGQYIFKFHGLSLAKDFRKYQSTLNSSMSGYRRLTDQEKLNRQPDRIHIKTVGRGGTLSEALSALGVHAQDIEDHAIINGMELNDRVESGTVLKVIGK